jgi:antitoxin PrlF
MGRSSTISSKGQITVPLEVRKRLGLKTGDRVEFVEEDKRTTIRPARAPENPFVKYVGSRPVFPSVRAINEWLQELREADKEGDKKR